MNMKPSPHIQLTEQQQAIVAHDAGPALVFAVAGAGKTTAMEYRIARLVRERIFAPGRIIAAAYTRSAAEELQKRLQHWPGCNHVTTTTLHALGYQIVRQAWQHGYLHLNREALQQVDGAAKRILDQSLAQARSRKVSYVEELNNLDRQNFLDYVGACKGRLAYADLARAQLPAKAQQVAVQAAAPDPTLAWYLAFYQLYEEVRITAGWLTFDDMLMTGWEVLVRYPDILAAVQASYEAVLVDEFQDVDQAQSELLDLITAPHRNYMVIGDDDQTIYEWRGAEPRFILGFEQRYQAKVYYMTENFRCRAGQVALANAVIQYNEERRPKRLQLTQGFDEETQLHLHRSADEMGRAIAQKVRSTQSQKQRLKEMVVLVRLYAQTPPIEQALIAAGIPYEIIGDVPFYARPEVQTLIDYCRLAYLERVMLEQHKLSGSQPEELVRAWKQVYWQPKRYISKELSEKVIHTAQTMRRPLSQTLQLVSSEAKPGVADKLQKLAGDLTWLMEALPPGKQAKQPAVMILRQLEERLGYCAYLEKQSGFAETGLNRAETVTAFINYANGKGNLQNFLQHVQDLANRNAVVQAAAPEDRLVITSIHRAKGQEWPLVIVPHCNENIIPYRQNANVEEERRLLYVAITRAKQELHLHALQDEPLSPFLVEAKHVEILKMIGMIRAALQRDPTTWSEPDVVAIGSYTAQLHLHGYLGRWWPAPEEQKRAVAQLVTRFIAYIEQQGMVATLDLKPQMIAFWRDLAGAEAAALPPLPMPQLMRRLQQQTTQNKRQSALARLLGKRPSSSSPPSAKKPLPHSTQPRKAGDLIEHPRFGRGKIISTTTGLDRVELKVDFGEHWGLVRLIEKDGKWAE